MNIKITFKTPQNLRQNRLKSQGMFIFCKSIKFSGELIVVSSDNDLNLFGINNVFKIEIA